MPTLLSPGSAGGEKIVMIIVSIRMTEMINLCSSYTSSPTSSQRCTRINSRKVMFVILSFEI